MSELTPERLREICNEADLYARQRGFEWGEARVDTRKLLSLADTLERQESMLQSRREQVRLLVQDNEVMKDQEQASSLRYTVKTLIAGNEQMSATVAQQAKRIADLEKQIEDFEAMARKNQAADERQHLIQLDGFNAALGKAQKRIAELEYEAAHQHERAEAMNASLRSEVERLKEQARLQMLADNEYADRVGERIDGLQVERDSLRKQLEKAHDDNQALDAKDHAYWGQVVEALGLTEQEATDQRIVEAAGDLRKQLEEAQAQYKIAIGEVGFAAVEIADLREKLAGAEDETANLRNALLDKINELSRERERAEMLDKLTLFNKAEAEKQHARAERAEKKAAIPCPRIHPMDLVDRRIQEACHQERQRAAEIARSHARKNHLAGAVMSIGECAEIAAAILEGQPEGERVRCNCGHTRLIAKGCPCACHPAPQPSEPEGEGLMLIQCETLTCGECHNCLIKKAHAWAVEQRDREWVRTLGFEWAGGNTNMPEAIAHEIDLNEAAAVEQERERCLAKAGDAALSTKYKILDSQSPAGEGERRRCTIECPCSEDGAAPGEEGK